MLSDKNSFMSTNCRERIFSTNFLGRTSPAGDKITPHEGDVAGRAEGSRHDQETTGVGAAGQRRGGDKGADANQETADTDVRAAEHVVDSNTVEVTATDVNQPGGGRCARSYPVDDSEDSST